MTFTVEVEADGRIKLPTEAQKRLERGEEIHLRKETAARASSQPRSLYEGDARLEMEDGWPVIVGGERFDSHDTLDAINHMRLERMAHVAGSGFTADDFE